LIYLIPALNKQLFEMQTHQAIVLISNIKSSNYKISIELNPHRKYSKLYDLENYPSMCLANFLRLDHIKQLFELQTPNQASTKYLQDQIHIRSTISCIILQN
jgi:hypothetical protein